MARDPLARIDSFAARIIFIRDAFSGGVFLRRAFAEICFNEIIPNINAKQTVIINFNPARQWRPGPVAAAP